MQQQQLDLAAVRARLAGQTGRQFWRSIEELAATDEFEDLLHREFPRQASGMMGPVSRRQVLQVMAASLALAGLTACTQATDEKIVPYIDKPEEIVPGRPLYFATAMTLGGYASGLIIESQMGRPIKAEGNPQHPASLGATDSFAQASLLGLYDPDRSQSVVNLALPSTWTSFQAELTPRLAKLKSAGGAGLHILTGAVTSPTFQSQMAALLKDYPQAKWYQYEPVGLDNLHAGAQLAFGQDINTVYRFDRATRVLALDSDFLYTLPGNLVYARQFADRRRVSKGLKEMNRLYMAESSSTVTGGMADHRLRLRPSQIEGLARAVAKALGVEAGSGVEAPPEAAEWIAAVVRDLQANTGASIVIAGEQQPPIVHALVHAINNALGNIGKTVLLTAPIEANPGKQVQNLRDLTTALGAGQVDTLIMIGGNPVYNAPVDLNFAQQLQRAAFRVHLNGYQDETSDLCQWHLPESHYLETWSDARSFDGTATIMQPLIQPLYDSKSAHELLAILQGDTSKTGREIIQAYWQSQFGKPRGLPAHGTFDQSWRTAVQDGIIGGTAAEPVTAALKADFAAQAAPSAAPAAGLEVVFRPDPTIWDGRYTNNAWLQELPKPVTTLSWDNPVHISPATAQRLGLSNGTMVNLDYRGQKMQAAVWIVPGHADETATLYLGYGRTHSGTVGTGLGFPTYKLRTSDAMTIGSGLQISSAGSSYELAQVQEHYSMEGRELVRFGTLDEYIADPAFAQIEEHGVTPDPSQVVPQSPSLFPSFKYEGHAWGMAIDLNSCIGCNRCTIACQAENNIPVVGKENVIRGREMHWLRVDRYYEGGLDNPRQLSQPRPCMHCEKAPCEVVCPVQATGHSSEGLNEMVYNRCVGTKYCSNNCPYKVRRFNYLNYTNESRSVPVLELLANPEVTVRGRGVMEKCTYCVQRIEHAKIEADKEDRPIRDGDVRTACQDVCPTQAIIFGDINDPQSEVRRLKQTSLNYGMLSELGTNPRTSYQARLMNPNPEIKTE